MSRRGRSGGITTISIRLQARSNARKNASTNPSGTEMIRPEVRAAIRPTIIEIRIREATLSTELARRETTADGLLAIAAVEIGSKTTMAATQDATKRKKRKVIGSRRDREVPAGRRDGNILRTVAITITGKGTAIEKIRDAIKEINVISVNNVSNAIKETKEIKKIIKNKEINGIKGIKRIKRITKIRESTKIREIKENKESKEITKKVVRDETNRKIKMHTSTEKINKISNSRTGSSMEVIPES
jgi:hypothetical protein